MLLQTRANRFAFLVGGLNSILYAIVGLSLGLYGSFFSALFTSFPLQILTFIRWNKKSYEHSTILKRLSNKARIVGVAIATGLWLLLYMILKNLGSEYALLDNTATVIGLTGTLLSLFRYIEYSFISVVSCIINLVLYITMLSSIPGQITYVVYTLYSLVCCIISFRFMTKLYIKQQKELEG